jgi:hypothetical protein
MTDDRLGPPPVEPLSDMTWARLERGLWARMDGSVTTQISPPSSRRWLWIAAPLAVAAAALAIVVIARDAPRTEIAERPGSGTSDVRVVAPPSAPTTATFDDAHIELAPASVVVMRHDRPTTVLERGAAWFVVAPRVERPPFVVVAGDTTVRVLGTRFRVARSEERVAVEVEHGAVEVTFRGRLQVLRDRQTWSSEHPDQIGPLAVADEEIEVEPAQIVRRAPTPKRSEKETALTKVEPKSEPRTESAGDPDHAKFERLVGLEKKNPQAAMAGYLELSRDSGKWAANALYAAGRLAADRGDPRAATLLKVYLRRFPSGANVVDARALLARVTAPAP